MRPRPHLLIILALLTLTAPPAIADGDAPEPIDLDGLLADFRSVAPDERGLDVSGRSARLGHFSVVMDRGAAFPLRTRRGEVLGLFLTGRGRYTYRSEDPFDLQTLAANLAGAPQAPPLSDGTLSDRFERLVFFFARPAFTGLWQAGSGLPPGPELTGEARLDLQRIWRRMTGAGGLGVDHLAAEARLNGPDLQYVEAEIEGGTGTVGYHYERLQDMQENLFRHRDLRPYGVRTIVPLSRQPLPPHADPLPPPLVLVDAGIEVETGDNLKGTIRSDLGFAVLRDGLRVVRLGLMNHRDRRNLRWDAGGNRLVVRGVTDDRGRPLPFSHRYKEILVVLAEEARRGDLLHLRFTADGEVLTSHGGRREEGYFYLLYDPWFPQPYGWGCSHFTFSLKVRTRRPFRPFAVGTSTTTRERDDSWDLEARSGVPVRGLGVVAGRFWEQTTQGVPPIFLEQYGTGHVPALSGAPRLAERFLRYYAQRFGPYPFDRLTVIEIPEYGPGTAPPGMAILTLGRKERGEAPTLAGVATMLAHQVAHQWFWHRAMPASTRDTWLSESFAWYAAALALEDARAAGESPVGLDAMLANWRSVARTCREGASIEAASSLSGDKGERFGRCLLEARGPLVIHMLRTLVGDESFLAIVRRLLDRAAAGTIAGADCERAATTIAREDLRWFFDQWIRKDGIPEVRVTTEVREADGRFTLTGRAAQPPGDRFRRLLIPLVVEYAGGGHDTFRLVQDRPSVEASFDLGGRPRRVRVDPDRDNLAIYR